MAAFDCHPRRQYFRLRLGPFGLLVAGRRQDDRGLDEGGYGEVDAAATAEVEQLSRRQLLIVRPGLGTMLRQAGVAGLGRQSWRVGVEDPKVMVASHLAREDIKSHYLHFRGCIFVKKQQHPRWD